MSEEITPCDGGAVCAAPEKAEWTKPQFRAVRGEDAYTVRVFMPGVSKETVTVSVENDIITVEGTRMDKPAESWKPVFTELGRADYRLRLELAADADGGRVKAAVADGVLILTVPVAEAAKPRNIAVK